MRQLKHRLEGGTLNLFSRGSPPGSSMPVPTLGALGIPPLLPPPPMMALHEESVSLRFAKMVSPLKRGLSPYYHFRIYSGLEDVGHLNLRVGESEHVQMVVGHIGFGIRKRFRGHRFALLACRALAPFARTVMPEMILTCDPGNDASRRTLERLVGGESGEGVRVPSDDPHYRRGARTKLRFRWVP